MEIPNNPTNHVAAQQYRMKSSIEEYEVNGLNALLMQMFKDASMFGAVPEDNQLIYFNVSYAIAAQLYNSPKGTMQELVSEVEMLLQKSKHVHNPAYIYQDEVLLCQWMILSILFLQDHKWLQLNVFLSRMKKDLIDHGKSCKTGISGFLAKFFPKMIAAVKERFHSPELYPLDPNELKIQALEAQLAAEKKKNEHFKAIEKSNYLTATFNEQLEQRCKKLERQLKEVLDSHRIEKETMQRIINQKDEQIKLLKVGAMNGIPQGTTGGVTVNNFYGSVAQQSNNANSVSSVMTDWMEEEKKRIKQSLSNL